ncbi:GNAT family N-acetyltransferase [Fodinicurvata halophila]|uniref:GNAT family N-acetyltransferase n=1 Tax=Fodinicurvata halophila TaxID=1419723 RepID=A0ABV8UIV2_9PROT
MEMIWRSFDLLSRDQLYELLRIRSDIFVVEQQSPYCDVDGLDREALHLLAYDRGSEFGGARPLAGYLRLLPPIMAGPAPVLGRIAVRPAFREQGYGRAMVQEGLSEVERRFRRQAIKLSAQTHLCTFYEAFGFQSNSPPYDDHGVPHVDMIRPAG